MAVEDFLAQPRDFGFGLRRCRDGCGIFQRPFHVRVAAGPSLPINVSVRTQHKNDPHSLFAQEATGTEFGTKVRTAVGQRRPEVQLDPSFAVESGNGPGNGECGRSGLIFRLQFKRGGERRKFAEDFPRPSQGHQWTLVFGIVQAGLGGHGCNIPAQRNGQEELNSGLHGIETGVPRWLRRIAHPLVLTSKMERIRDAVPPSVPRADRGLIAKTPRITVPR